MSTGPKRRLFWRFTHPDSWDHAFPPRMRRPVPMHPRDASAASLRSPARSRTDSDHNGCLMSEARRPAVAARSHHGGGGVRRRRAARQRRVAACDHRSGRVGRRVCVAARPGEPARSWINRATAFQGASSWPPNRPSPRPSLANSRRHRSSPGSRSSSRASPASRRSSRPSRASSRPSGNHRTKQLRRQQRARPTSPVVVLLRCRDDRYIRSSRTVASGCRLFHKPKDVAVVGLIDED